MAFPKTNSKAHKGGLSRYSTIKISMLKRFAMDKIITSVDIDISVVWQVDVINTEQTSQPCVKILNCSMYSWKVLEKLFVETVQRSVPGTLRYG